MLVEAYIEEVMKFRKALNLTSISDPTLFYERFISPSEALAEWIPDKGRMLDVGSGMGVPGIPLLIAKPDIVGVLVERRKKRAEFLRHVIRKLGLTAEVYDADINDLPCLNVDVCVARAVTDEAGLLKMCASHANHGAVAVLPVPLSHHPKQVTGWEMMAEHSIAMKSDQHDVQRIRCYQYG